MTTTLIVSTSPKMVREALCVAEHAVNRHVTEINQHGAPEVLAALIRECDRHRPLGPDGKHGQRHTPTCGCEDMPERYRPKSEHEPLRATAPQRRATAALYEHVTDIAKAGGASVELLAHQLARRALVAALADLDELARAADPQAFEHHPIEARSAVASLQWSVRRKNAHEHAERIVARILGGTP